MDIETPDTPAAISMPVEVIAAGSPALVSKHFFWFLDAWGIFCELLKRQFQSAAGDAVRR